MPTVNAILTQHADGPWLLNSVHVLILAGLAYYEQVLRSSCASSEEEQNEIRNDDYFEFGCIFPDRLW